MFVVFSVAVLVGERFEPVTTAFFGIKAEALICYDKSMKKYVYDKIRAVFGKMIRGGATSFYETEKGKEDFETAGSLCHAWASAPAYLYAKYFTDLFTEKTAQRNAVTDSVKENVKGKSVKRSKDNQE